MKEMKILVLDIETTGFLDKGGKIVEIGIVELNLENGNRKILFDSVVHEKGITKEEIENSWIINNSSLSVEDVQHSPDLRRVTKWVQGIIDAYPLGITAYNNVFDFGFMESRGFVFANKLPCPMKLSTDICQIPGKFNDFKWPSVEEAYEYFFPDSNYDEEHRGADDAMHESEIIHELYYRGVFKLKS